MNSRQTLCVVLDVSGSMAETGKIDTARLLISYLRESLVLANPPLPFERIQLVPWDGAPKVISLVAGIPTPELNAGGRSDIEELLRTLSGLFVSGDCFALLFLTDGHFAADPLRKKLRGNTIPARAVMIGADADEANLRSVFGRDAVFAAEDIYSAFRDWPLKVAESASTPISHAAAMELFAAARRATANTDAGAFDEGRS